MIMRGLQVQGASSANGQKQKIVYDNEAGFDFFSTNYKTIFDSQAVPDSTDIMGADFRHRQYEIVQSE